MIEEHWGPVHGGARYAWHKKELECNAYCKGNVHCDLIYAASGASEERILRSAQRTYDPRCFRVQRATEAPPPNLNAMYAVNDPSTADLEGWLVFWEVPQ